VSAHIKALEEILGLSLFERTPKGMALTPAGLEMLVAARAALSAAERVGMRARELRGELMGVLKVGMNTDAAFLRLPAIQRLMAERHPQLALELLAGSTGANLSKLEAGQLQASFVSGEVDGARYDYRFLRDEDMAIAAPRAWSERLATADLSALADAPWIHNAPDHIQTRVLETLFSADGLAPRRAAVINRKDSILAMVASQLGLAISRRTDIERAAAQHDIVALPIRLPPVPLGLAWPRVQTCDPALAALIAAVETVWTGPA